MYLYSFIAFICVLFLLAVACILHGLFWLIFFGAFLNCVQYLLYAFCFVGIGLLQLLKYQNKTVFMTFLEEELQDVLIRHFVSKEEIKQIVIDFAPDCKETQIVLELAMAAYNEMVQNKNIVDYKQKKN